MPQAKFRADLLKTVAVHKEQRTDRQTDTPTFDFIYTRYWPWLELQVNLAQQKSVL